jgi:Glycosyl hydrolase family 26
VNASGKSTIRNLVAAAAIVASAVAFAAPAAAAAAPIKLGVYTAAQGQLGAPEDAAWLDNYAETVGRRPDIVMDYSNVTDPLLTQREISNLQARGETPMVTWQLFQSGYSGPTISLDQLAAGGYDSYLHKAAALAKTLPFEVMIRFGHEMNGDWYGWSGNPTAYVNAWRHVVEVFRQDGATNVKWVWSPTVDYGDYPFASYFPGDSWVDYVALDGYNWGTAGVGANKWESLRQVFASSYAKITQLSSKPVIIAETSSSEVGGNKADWIREGFLKTIPQDFPRVSAVIWFDRDAEEDWRINTSSAALAAYREVVASTLYGGNVAPVVAEATEPPPVVEELEVTPVVPPAPTSTSAAPKKRKARRQVRVRGRGSYRVSKGVTSVKLMIKGPGLTGSRAKRALTISHPKTHGTFRLSNLSGGRLLRDRRYRVVAIAIRGGSVSEPRRTHFRVAPQYQSGVDAASVAS